MKFEIETARHQHRVRDERALREQHTKSMAKARAFGDSVQVHTSAHEVHAYINHGKWVGMCECGSGVATDPAFAAAYCFGCGAIHNNVVFPADRLEIEHLLLARPRSENRNWDARDTLVKLLADNGEHGVNL